jgi:predicted nucleic acid-binding protein
MLIDSNILIYALNQSSPKQISAQDFLQTQPQLVLAQQNIFETLRILTHQRFPSPFSVEKAIRAVQEIAEQASVIFPTHETTELALQLIRKYEIKGTEIFDAYLVATALSNEISQIATDNVTHLRKYTEIEVLNPFV